MSHISICGVLFKIYLIITGYIIKMKIPFSVYDFFGYLSSGALLIASFDFVFSRILINKKDIEKLKGAI